MNKVKFNLPGALLVFSFFLWSCNGEESPNLNTPLPAVDLFDQSYGSDPRQSLDVYLPEGRTQESTPLLIYIHGGAWIDGNKEEFINFRTILESSFEDYAFVSINYRLANLGSGVNLFPSQEDDVISAVEYITSKTADWNISDSIILSGASAGGHLALLHAYKHQEIGDIQGVLAFFPPTDLLELYDFNFLTEAGLNVLLGGTPAEVPENYAASSPLNFINSASIPTAVYHGDQDTVVPFSQSQLLKDKLLEFGVAHTVVFVQGEGHGFTSSRYPDLLIDASAFFEQNLGR